MTVSPTVLHYDAFSSVPNMGNPAGVVLDADALSEQQMQKIAKRVGFNETSFVMQSDKADYRLRYFTPGHEMPLCGHATIASTLALVEARLSAETASDFVFETSVGPIEVAYRLDRKTNKPAISMKQTPAEFVEFTGNLQKLVDVLGIETDDLHPTLPVVYGNTGTWTLLVPVATRESIRKMIPKTSEFSDALKQMPRSSIHPFTLETINVSSHMHARHFSSPFSGTIEDPVTGTASGAMAAYMAKHSPSFYSYKNGIAVIEQGFEVGRDGRVKVEMMSDSAPYLVKITGTAVYVGKL